MTPYFIAALRLLLALIFIVAGIGKSRKLDLFSRQVAAYKVLPSFLVRPVAYFLPWLELILGFLLLFGWHTKIAAALTGFMYAVFTAALSVNLVRGRKDLDCGCFGSQQKHKITRWLVVRDICLMLAAIGVNITGGGSFSFDNLARETQLIGIYSLREYLLPIGLVALGLIMFHKLFSKILRLVNLSTRE